MKALSGFLNTQTQITLKDVCGHMMLKSLIGHICQRISYS